MHFFEIGSIYSFSILELLKLPKIAQNRFKPISALCASIERKKCGRQQKKTNFYTMRRYPHVIYYWRKPSLSAPDLYILILSLLSDQTKMYQVAQY